MMLKKISFIETVSLFVYLNFIISYLYYIGI